MVCLYCRTKLIVNNSRPQKKSNNVWRRRKCTSCNAVFTTVESIDYGSIFVCQKTSTNLEPFSRDKLLISIYRACKHRKHPETDATALTDTVIADIASQTRGTVLQKTDIVAAVTEVLSNFDTAAKVQYRAYNPL